MSHHRSKPSIKLVLNLLTIGLLVGWWLTLAPTQFGGPASYIKVDGHSMDGTYATGDLIVMREKASYEAGDIVAYRARGGQVIHRITGGNGRDGYVLQGDNNPDPDPWHPKDADVLGSAVHRFAGSAHLLELPAKPWFAGLTAGLLTILMLLPEGLKERRLTRLSNVRTAGESQPARKPQTGGVPTQRTGAPAHRSEGPAHVTALLPRPRRRIDEARSTEPS